MPARMVALSAPLSLRRGHLTCSGRWLWMLVALLAVRLASAEEEEKASPLALGIAATLLGQVGFQMSLLYLTNHTDPDMRKYTYEIISSTISIFCAVLLFSTFNDALEFYVLEGLPPHQQCAIDMLHMLFWYVMMQLSLAYICGAMGGETAPDDHKSESDKKAAKNDFELNVKTSSQLLAHLTGFASINAWGSLQQLPYFSQTPAMTLYVLPMSAVGQFVLQRITDYIRTKIGEMDGDVDESEQMWDEEAEECENDVMGLTLSFNAAQSIRYYISAPPMLPNQEGAWPLDFMIAQPTMAVLKLFTASMIAAMLVCLVISTGIMPEEEGEEAEGSGEEDEEEYMEEAEAVAGEAGHKGHGHGKEDSESAKEGSHQGQGHKKTLFTELLERLAEVAVITFSMIFAWCSFYSGQMMVAGRMSTGFGDLDKMTLGMALTIFLSGVSFACIRVLDLIADADFTGDRADQAIKMIIKAIGILVGFAWEQCFDEAVASLASRTLAPHLVKAVLAVLCIVIIVPAYKRFILPMAVQEGWKFGFVVKQIGEIGDLPDTANMVLKHLEKQVKQVEEGEGGQTLAKIKKATHKLHKALNVDGDHYAKIPGSEGEELRKLKRENASYKEALKEGIKALKHLQQAEHDRADGMRSHNQQMDSVLTRVRELETRVYQRQQHQCSPRC